MQGTASKGALSAGAAFIVWGLFPLYWYPLAAVPALQLLAHRILWCALAVWLYLFFRRDWRWVTSVSPKILLLLVLGAVLITLNWGTYVWAVVSNRVIETSLGYYLTPFVNIVIAVLVLRERLRPLQAVAVACAALGVLWLAVKMGAPPWVALMLALSFGVYGLVRKLAPFDAVRGLAVESSVMVLPALLYLIWCEVKGQAAFGHGAWHRDLMLVLSGPLTAIPLVMFSFGAQRISMLALGILQFISPTVALILGVWLFQEPFTGARVVGFACIWVALAIFSGDAFKRFFAK
jgi:chloramphenicol-sensitive protein RarD